MFKKRIVVLVLAFSVALGFLIWKWNDIPGSSLEAGAGPVSAQRLVLDLRGAWDIYPTLRQAWVTESERLSQQKPEHPLTAGQSILLPSTQKFHVAVRRFRIPAEWSARSVLFELRGIKGQGKLYLNGMESVNEVGEFSEDGGTEEILLPANALHYGEDNLLLIESSAPPLQRDTLFGLNWPAKGQIQGSMQLVATMETSLSIPRVSVRWEQGNAILSVQTQLTHHGFSEDGPWSVQGVVSDGSAEAAAASTQVNLAESPTQTVDLTFTIPQAHRWSPQNPFLYQLYLTVTNPQGDKDDLSVPVGLTSITYQQGKFLLNGQALTVKGTVLSSDQEEQLRHEGKAKDWLKEQKNKGYNLVYFMGSFPDDLWLNAADQLGIGIWAELPVGMIPANRLPNPSIWEDELRQGSDHASLWAFTAGKGLEVDNRAPTVAFWKKVQTQSTVPVFVGRISSSPWIDPSMAFLFTSQGFQGTWGKVSYDSQQQTQGKGLWTQERLLSEIWAAAVLLIILINVGTVNWRYKELKERKPKRALRKAWFWQGLAVLSREGTLAGILTSLIYNLQVPWAEWFPDQWPYWAGIKQQSPILVWFILALFFVLLRLLQIGVAAPHMPDAPAPLGLTLWLERRYRWAWIAAALWAAQPWGIPWYLPLAVYFGLTLLFLPFRLRDVHKAGGKYLPFSLVPGILFATFLMWALWRGSDFYYLWRLAVAFKLI